VLAVLPSDLQALWLDRIKLEYKRVYEIFFMGEQQSVEEPKLVIVYFANGNKQWVKIGSTNQWARDGGKVHKFYEGKVYTTSDGRKIKMKQHFKLLNAVFMDIETGEFLETDRHSLLDLQPHEKSVVQHCKWWEVDWKCEIDFDKKTEKRPIKPRSESAAAIDAAPPTRKIS
jgi:hypothetical protein